MLSGRQLGTVVGWSSSGFYLGSRLSQIWKNYSRHSAEGLSLAMFACAITANICYGLGIVLRAYSWDVVWSSAPWLLGSLGTVSLDLVIFTQVRRCVVLCKKIKCSCCMSWFVQMQCPKALCVKVLACFGNGAASIGFSFMNSQYASSSASRIATVHES